VGITPIIWDRTKKNMRGQRTQFAINPLQMSGVSAPTRRNDPLEGQTVLMKSLRAVGKCPNVIVPPLLPRVSVSTSIELWAEVFAEPTVQLLS
jgi:hypothetical protein